MGTRTVRRIVARWVKDERKKYGRDLEIVLHHNENQSASWDLSKAEGGALLLELGRLLRAPHAGRSILEILWEELDSVMERLMASGGGEPGYRSEELPSDVAEAYQEWGEERGRAQGIAYCIAVITNPYEPSVPAVKKEAARRWEARNAGD